MGAPAPAPDAALLQHERNDSGILRVYQSRTRAQETRGPRPAQRDQRRESRREGRDPRRQRGSQATSRQVQEGIVTMGTKIEVIKALRGARLMLYAWRGARKNMGLADDHGELNQTISEIETALSKLEP